jgi:sugar lactone lactonase YvrE
MIVASPRRAVEGARVTLSGSGLENAAPGDVTIAGTPAHLVFSSPRSLVVVVPHGLAGGVMEVRGASGWTAPIGIGAIWATGLHQVDSPVFDPEGNLLVTYSGPRGQESPVSVFRVTPSGARQPFVSGIVNATSLAYGPDGSLYVSSRFDGAVYRIDASGTPVQVASDLGVACGLAFDHDGWMYVGDRSGTVFRVRDSTVVPFVTLPPSVAAFHLAMSPTGDLFVAAPTLGSYDHVYKVDRHGNVEPLPAALGRPQGLTFGPDGSLYVADALAAGGGVYRFADLRSEPELVVGGSGLVGVAFGADGACVVASNHTAYRFEPDIG